MSGGGRLTGIELPNETVITWQAPPLRFGLGATEEIGDQLRALVLAPDEAIELVGLQGPRPGHERANGAGLRAAATRHARRLVERDEVRGRDQ